MSRTILPPFAALRRVALALLLALVCAAPSTRLAAQAPPGEPGAIANEQRLLEQQISRLEKTMRNLRDRLATEGRPRALELLDQGLALLAQRDAGQGGLTVREHMNESTKRSSDRELSRSLEHQEAIVARLEQLLAVLLDRASLDKLDQRAEEAAALTQALTTLSAQQQELRDRAEQAAEQALGPEGQALQRALEALAQAQRDLLARGLAEARADGTLEREQIAAALSELQRAQSTDRAVLQSFDAARAAALDALSKQLAAQAGAEPGAAQQGAQTPEQRNAAAAARVQAARAALEALRDGAHDRSPDAAAAAAERALEALASAPDAEHALERASEVLQQQAAQLAQVGPMLTASQRAQARAARALAQQAAASGALDPGARAPLGEDLRAAGDAMERASEALRQGDEPAAEQAAQAAEDALTRAAAHLQQAQAAQRAQPSNAQSSSSQTSGSQSSQPQGAENQASQSTAGAQARAAEQQQLLERAAENAARVAGSEAQQSPEGASPSEARASDALREAQQRMTEARDALQRGEAQRAADAQDRAATALDAARERLARQAGPRDEAQRSEAEALARAQEELERKMLELAERMQDPQREAAQQHTRNAASRASDAARSLRNGSAKQGAEQAEEARQELEQARQQMREEEQRYQRLRQEELLFQIAEELSGLATRQRALREETAATDRERAGAEAPSRAQKIRLRKLSNEASQLARRCGELSEALANEESLVFAEALSDTRLDLLDLAARMGEEGDWDSGPLVQGLQLQIEERLAWLQQSLNAERERRRQEEEQPQDDAAPEQQNGDERLIPDVAELRLLRQLEQELAEQLTRLEQVNPELARGGEADAITLREIQRLATRHEKITALFARLRARLQLPDPESAVDVEVPPHSKEQP